MKELDPKHIDALIAIVGEKGCTTDLEARKEYGHDETEDLNFPPAVVIKPASVKEVSEVLGFANTHGIPVTPIGARTGLSGGALSIHGGIGLSMERFNRILDIDEKNLQATVEPGVITQVFQDAVKEKGLMYPPDPASRGSCFIGGNVAENSGGPKAVKYGVTKDYVLNLEVVLPSGEVIWTGANTLKNSTGYNFTQLLVGSEGTLGVITKIVMRLIPHPTQDLLMLVPFRSAEKACEAVSEIFRRGIIPSGMEFMERDAIEYAMDFIGEEPVPLGAEDAAHLLIEVDGNDLDALMGDCERIAEVVEAFDCGEILFAEDQSKKDQLWKLRRRVGEAVKAQSIYKEEDTVVPRFELPALLKAVKEIGKLYGFRSVCYGHAGDGNLHVNILRDEMCEEDWNKTTKEGIRALFERVKELGGTISGEHGIGLVQRDYMDIMFSKGHLELMRAVKRSFDPNGILNPGKIF
ncbi:MAG: FAD-binding protein [Flavobacteriales bacterium]|nr:FAD-binding protein [Flavobacteriales bacterium]